MFPRCAKRWRPPVNHQITSSRCRDGVIALSGSIWPASGAEGVVRPTLQDRPSIAVPTYPPDAPSPNSLIAALASGSGRCPPATPQPPLLPPPYRPRPDPPFPPPGPPLPSPPHPPPPRSVGACDGRARDGQHRARARGGVSVHRACAHAQSQQRFGAAIWRLDQLADRTPPRVHRLQHQGNAAQSA